MNVLNSKSSETKHAYQRTRELRQKLHTARNTAVLLSPGENRTHGSEGGPGNTDAEVSLCAGGLLY